MTDVSAQTAAAQAARTRDIQFLSLMAHDLRQPPNVVIGMAVALDGRWEDMAEAERRSYVGVISRSATWMRVLLDDVIAAGKSVDGTLAFTPVSFSVPDLIEETIRDLDPTMAGRLTLHASDDLPLGYGDPVQQRQVVQNLLDNALKYSGDETQIHVGITVHVEMIAVSIADRGIGIDAHDIPTLFDRYVRVDDEEHVSSIDGSGLGLFVCQAMVTAQGGEIDVVSTPGVGSIFTYTLPIAS